MGMQYGNGSLQGAGWRKQALRSVQGSGMKSPITVVVLAGVPAVLQRLVYPAVLDLLRAFCQPPAFVFSRPQRAHPTRLCSAGMEHRKGVSGCPSLSPNTLFSTIIESLPLLRPAGTRLPPFPWPSLSPGDLKRSAPSPPLPRPPGCTLSRWRSAPSRNRR